MQLCSNSAAACTYPKGNALLPEGQYERCHGSSALCSRYYATAQRQLCCMNAPNAPCPSLYEPFDLKKTGGNMRAAMASPAPCHCTPR
eukprot:1159025-Pelagomonas_calceolata.AAC.3